MTQLERLIKESPSGKQYTDVLELVNNTKDIEVLRKAYLDEIKVQVLLNDFVDYVHSQEHKLYVDASQYSNQFIKLY